MNKQIGNVVHGYHNISEIFVIEMEYVDGYSLARVLDGVNAKAPLTFERMLEWTLQILDGLAAVIETASGVAKLTDFGLSRRLEDVWVWTKRHGTEDVVWLEIVVGDVCGVEAYMAPEVALDGRRGRNVSDIYSLGVLLYEMATGRLPYNTPNQLLTGVAVAKPREINRDIPLELEAAILRAMERRPEKRYPDCASMRADIATCLANLRKVETEHDLPARVAPSQLGFRPPSSSPLFYLELAKQKLAENDDQGALEAAEAAVDRSDGHPQYLRMLGGICVRLGYHRKAAEAYERLLATYDRGYPVEMHQRREVLERLGQLHVLQQQYARAVEVYEALVRVVDRPYSRFRLAIAVGLDGDFARAISLLEDVRKARPDAVVVYSKLGWAHALNGDDRLALSFYNQALALDAFDLFSLYQMGQYFHIVGDRRRSAEYFRRVVEADREGTYAAKVRELVGAAG